MKEERFEEKGQKRFEEKGQNQERGEKYKAVKHLQNGDNES